MGTGIGRRLHASGAIVRTSLQGRSAASRLRVEQAGLEVRNDYRDLIDQADFLFSIVPPGQALAAAKMLVGPLQQASEKPVYVECNAVSPRTVNEVARVLGETGCRFIDAGIIGGPPPADLEKMSDTPKIYASGESASSLYSLSRYGLNIKVIDAKIGSASAFKMCYAGLAKGLTAIGSVISQAAARNDLAALLHDELTASQPELLRILSRRIPDMLPKAYRWVAEMEEIADFLGRDTAGALMFNGAAQIYSSIEGQRASDSQVCIAQILAILSD
ncbi:MAG: NAD(P)-dependent oxidoreductase [Candidatus Binataceae bacterium]|nr:NAD(P)-dependent oxidoreductase [Candidatus Binataceae bacterium]